MQVLRALSQDTEISEAQFSGAQAELRLRISMVLLLRIAMQAESLLKRCHGKPFPHFFLLLLPVSFMLTVLLNTPPCIPSASHASHTWVCLPSLGMSCIMPRH